MFRSFGLFCLFPTRWNRHVEVRRFYSILELTVTSCVVCNSILQLEDFIIDAYFLKLLEKYPNEDKCLIYPDGRDDAAPVHEKHEKGKKRKLEDVDEFSNSFGENSVDIKRSVIVERRSCGINEEDEEDGEFMRVLFESKTDGGGGVVVLSD